MKLKHSARMLCNISSSEIYLETEQPGLLYRTDFNLRSLDTINLHLKSNATVSSLFKTHVDFPDVFIAAGNLPAVIKARFNSSSFYYYHVPPVNFTESVMIDKTDFVFRGYKKFSNGWDQIFIKADLAGGKIEEEKNISERRGDAGFSTDGLLYFDRYTNRILYVYHYSNRFICMDTALHLLYQTKTIDTTASFKVETKSIVSRGNTIITNTAPLIDVNVVSCVNEGRLFNISKRKADNETRVQFENNAVVDVYRVIDGSYEESFYIPFYHGEKMQDFKLSGPYLIVLYATYMVTYKLPGSL